jgi:hypothetical protein
VRLDPWASSMDKGAKWWSALQFPYTKTVGEMGVWSTAPGGGRREGGEPSGVGMMCGGGGLVGVVHELGRRSLRVWAGHVGLARRAVPLFIYSKKIQIDLIK